ncbi:unnamed protein product [Heligmosomoides polygyrus]|uniref:VWFA domain-containing protein n=1 Tax=Heligmosomoides polygyrus TaxID=6339 RepID=A0A183F2M7_HELPZ|nr:unnamed protein product [Heligmosomoides polygyrus]
MRRKWKILVQWILLSTVFLYCSAETKKNVILIITDDQDIELGSMNYMPKVTRLMKDKGTEFRGGFHFVPIMVFLKMSTHRTAILELHRQGKRRCNIVILLGRLSPQKLIDEKARCLAFTTSRRTTQKTEELVSVVRKPYVIAVGAYEKTIDESSERQGCDDEAAEKSCLERLS